jgi:hypothetical protein
MVRRNGVLCYSIEATAPANVSGFSYVVRDAAGTEVATGAAVDKSGFVAMTCKGGTETRVSSACLHPASDTSDCSPGTCPY